MKKNNIVLTVLAGCLFAATVAGLSQGNGRIQSLMASYRYGEALTVADSLLQEHPDLREGWMAKGKAWRELCDFEASAAAFGKVLGPDSTDRQALIELAVTNQLRQDYPAAIRCFNKVLATEPDNRYLQLERAHCEMQAGRYPDALLHWLELYAQDSTNLHIVKSLGLTFHELNMFPEAVSCYRKALQLQPSDAGSALSLARIYQRQKLWEAGIAVTEGFRKLDSSNREVNALNAQLYLAAKRYPAAIALFRKCIAAGDTSKGNWKNLGIALYSTNEYDDGKTALEKAYALDTTDASTAHFLGICCYRSYYKKLGIDYLEKAIALYGPNEEKLSTVCRNYAEACSAWSPCPEDKKLEANLMAYRYQPNDSILAYSIGNGYAKRKDYFEAVYYLERFYAAMTRDTTIKSFQGDRLEYHRQRINYFRKRLIEVSETKPVD